MKATALLAAILVSVFSSSAELVNVEELWSHLFTNGSVIWQAPTNNLPRTLWVYKKVPRIFSATTISNAVTLASFQEKGFPKPSTNQTIIWADRFYGEMQPPYFSILPDEWQISYTLGDRAPQSPDDISTNEEAVQHAWDCLAQIGIDRTQFLKTNVASSGAYGVFLPRQIDGIKTYYDTEGFQIEFGKHGKTMQFCLLFPNLERDRQSQVASPQEIIQSIRAHKAIVQPDPDEVDYFARLRLLENAKKLIITKVSLFYGDGLFGETSTNGESSKIVVPVAELEGLAEFDNSNATVRILSPVLSSEVRRLLGNVSPNH